MASAAHWKGKSGMLNGFTPVKFEYGKPDTRQFDGIYVETRDGFDGRKWAITQRGNCFAKDGTWEYEPVPSSRDDDFRKRCRWDTAEEAAEFLLSNLAEAMKP
jgi:hypothetical protein